MFGLIVSDPNRDETRRKQLSALLYSLDIPLTAFTEEPAADFTSSMSCAAFLRTASAVLLMPGRPILLDALLSHLPGPDPLPGNVIRRYLFLQLSLLPYLRPGREVRPLEGSFLLGSDLLILPVTAEDTVDVLLPPGVWTELTGTVREGRLRGMRGYNEMPVLVRANALIPIGVNDRIIDHDDADRLTLHWFQPDTDAECTLADGTRYQAKRTAEHFAIHGTTNQPFHLIIHQDGVETLVL